MVKFSQSGISENILKTVRNRKPNNLFINENLTPMRARYLYAVRRAKRRFPQKVDGCGTTGGRVFVWLKPLTPGGRNIRAFIDSEFRLRELCEKSFGVMLDDLLGPVTGN